MYLAKKGLKLGLDLLALAVAPASEDVDDCLLISAWEWTAQTKKVCMDALRHACTHAHTHTKSFHSRPQSLCISLSIETVKRNHCTLSWRVLPVRYTHIKANTVP